MKRSTRVILLVVLLLVVALPALHVIAQTPDPASLKTEEESDGRAYLFAALILTWIGIVIFLAVLFRGQQRIGRRLDRIERNTESR